MLSPDHFRRFRFQLVTACGLVLSVTALAQPTVQIGLFPSDESGQLDVRLKANGDFDQLLSNLLFTISWPTSSGIGLNNAELTNLCDRLPIVPNGDGVQQSGGRSYQTFFMLSLQSLAGGCPLLNGQELTVMRIPVTGLSACTDISIANDGYTANNNKNYYISLNGQDRTGSVYGPTATLCSCMDLTLSITTDNQPAQIGWEIYSNGQLQYSGTLKPGQTNRTVTLSSCEPNGCYRVRLTDAGGNGISGGGYTVKLGSDRIIDATGAFGSSSGLKNNGTFCIPLGPTFLKPPYEDLTGIAANTILRAKKITGANSYTFWLFDPHGTFDTTITRNGPKLKLSPNLWNRIPHDLSLNVRVNSGTGGVYGPFGKTCTAMLGGSQQLRTLEEIPVGTEDALTVFPNPVQDNTVHVRYRSAESEAETRAVIEVLNTTGQIVLREESTFNGTLDKAVLLPSGTASGVYMLTFTTGSERLVRRVVQP